MPRQNSDDGWVGADGVDTEADEPETGEVPEVPESEVPEVGVSEVPEESEVPEGEVPESEVDAGAGHPFHGGGRWHAPAICSPP